MYIARSRPTVMLGYMGIRRLFRDDKCGPRAQNDTTTNERGLAHNNARPGSIGIDAEIAHAADRT